MIPVRASRWFIYTTTGLIVFLCLAVLFAGLILMRRGLQPRVGQVNGSSMEPTFPGPRVHVKCENCDSDNAIAFDTYQVGRLNLCQRCGAALPKQDSPMVEAGATVRYFPLRMVRRLRQNSKSQKTAASIQIPERGDVVVIERSSDSPREIKRVVGLPNEPVEIRDGDIWVDEKRYAKSFQQALRQAILVAQWTPVDTVESLDVFLNKLELPITNKLDCNAHAPHAKLAVNDVGIGLRFAHATKEWSSVITISNATRKFEVLVNATSKGLFVATGDDLNGQDSRQVRESTETPVWLFVIAVDGRLVLGTEKSELAAFPAEIVSQDFSSAKTESDGQPEPSPANWSARILEGEIKFDRCLVIRDIHYRGIVDRESERFEAAPGLIVLGDNVAVSQDSRTIDETNAPSRIPLENIRGVVWETENALDSLLRQASWTAE